MATEGTDAEDLQQHDSDPGPTADAAALPSEQAQESVASDAASTDTHHDEGADGEDEPNPLEPGGKRFKQVYARAKDAEAKLQQIREDKARLEGELAATRTAAIVPEPKVEPRLTWTQLEAGIADGKITQAQALDYRDETLRLDLEKKFEKKLHEERTDRERRTTVTSDMAAYKSLVPNVLSVGTPERQKVEREFAYLVNHLGHDPKDLRTELMAMRAAFGDIQTIKEKQVAREIPNGRSTMQDIPANGKPKPDAKDPLKTISGEQRKYYQRMIDKGQYKNWAAVREELEFVPKR